MLNFENYSSNRISIIIGATLIFGIVGGTYLLSKTELFSQLTDRRGKKKKPDLCNVCFAELNTENIKTCIPCCCCDKFVCRGKNCSYWLPKLAKWECQLCNLSAASQYRTNEWINKQGKNENKIYHPIRARSELNIPALDDGLSTTGSLNHIPGYSKPPSSLCEPNLDREKIRNHVEDILSEMLGGSLDNITVGPMLENKQYLPLWERNNSTNDLDNNNPTNISHVKLKRLIEKIIEETLRIPQLTDFSDVPAHLSNENFYQQSYDRLQQQNQLYNRQCSIATCGNDYNDYNNEVDRSNSQYFDPKKYQELLATAVLNKIVESCTTENKSINEVAINNNKLAITSELCGTSSSSSSHDPRSDSSLTDPVQDTSLGELHSHLYADTLNDNFDHESIISDSRITSSHRNIPDIISSDNDSLEDYVSATSGADSTWEENWLFKKRTLLTHPTNPIGMLVPAPKEDIKTMIGDKSADELSDFSENEEDDINGNRNDSGPENDRIQNKIVIGGQNTVGIFDDLMEQTSLISRSSSSTENHVFITETKNDYVDFKYGLNIKENSSLDLTCGGVPIKNEAVNAAIAVELLKSTKVPVEGSEINTKSNNSSSTASGNPIQKRTSSDSTITDESTHTILDASDEPQNLIPVENHSRSTTKIFVNGNVENSEQNTVSTLETNSNIVNENCINNTENSDSNNLNNNLTNLTTNNQDVNVPNNKTITSNTNNDSNNTNININTNTIDNESNINSSGDGIIIKSENNVSNNNNDLISDEDIIDTNNANSANTTPKLINTKNTEAFCKTLDISDDDEQNINLIPGSIAEREHKKWYNAVEMPNNPYAPEALLRRLDSGPEKPLDIPEGRVSNAKITTPEEEEEENLAEVKFNTKKIDLSIYSRDYYVPSTKINTKLNNKLTKIPCIERDQIQQSNEINLNKSVEDQTCIKHHLQDETEPKTSCSTEEQQTEPITNSNDTKIVLNTLDNKNDIFSARLIEINDSTEDEQNKSGTEISLLSSSDKFKADLSPSDISLTNSLTLSEDSDTLRIYNLKKQETTFVLKENQQEPKKVEGESTSKDVEKKDLKETDLHAIRTPPNTPNTPTTPNLQKTLPRAPRIRPNELKLAPVPSQSSIKTGKTAMVLTPQSFKFLHPKRKIIEPSQIMIQEQYSTPPETPDKAIIEEDVMYSLPSVKALAKAYLLTSGKCADMHEKVRPKSLIVETSNTETKEQIRKSASQDYLVESSIEIMVSNQTTKQDDQLNIISIDERPVSPVLTPGKLKDNIAFFENLKKI